MSQRFLFVTKAYKQSPNSSAGRAQAGGLFPGPGPELHPRTVYRVIEALPSLFSSLLFLFVVVIELNSATIKPLKRWPPHNLKNKQTNKQAKPLTCRCVKKQSHGHQPTGEHVRCWFDTRPRPSSTILQQKREQQAQETSSRRIDTDNPRLLFSRVDAALLEKFTC